MLLALRRQPFRSLYLAYQFLTTIFIRVPVWFVLAIPKSWRPRTSWSIKRTLLVKLARQFGSVTILTGPILTTPDYRAITPGKDVKGVWVEPVPQLITGDLNIWASIASVSSIPVPGYWIHKLDSTIQVAAPPMPGEKVIYALHGGAYIGYSGHPSDPTAAIARGLLLYCDKVHRVFSLEYRLSAAAPLKPAHPFPAALLDALAGYNYLVNTVGFSSDDIIIEGDSAGGNLAHALTRYLVEYKGTPQVELPAPPSGLLLISPWVDISSSHEFPGSSACTCANSDYIGQPTSRNYSRTAFLGPHGKGAAELNRYISPASLHPAMNVTFKGFPRTFIVAGGAEGFVDQIRTLKDRMIKDIGESTGDREGGGAVTYYEAPDAMHDYLLFSWVVPEWQETLKEIGIWMAA